VLQPLVADSCRLFAVTEQLDRQGQKRLSFAPEIQVKSYAPILYKVRLNTQLLWAEECCGCGARSGDSARYWW
jgi:hypothetical protein